MFYFGIVFVIVNSVKCVISYMKKILVILLLCVVAATAMAQKTLSGTILPKTDGQPIEMATVRLFAYEGGDSTMVQGHKLIMMDYSF